MTSFVQQAVFRHKIHRRIHKRPYTFTWLYTQVKMTDTSELPPTQLKDPLRKMILTAHQSARDGECTPAMVVQPVQLFLGDNLAIDTKSFKYVHICLKPSKFTSR